MGRLTFFALVALFVSFTPAYSTHATGANGSRITAAANTTLRELPSPTAPAVAQVPLGTEVTESGPSGLDKRWIRVRLSDGREGWLISSLTKPIDPVWRWTAYDGVIAERLGRKGDGFSANIELVAFIDRITGEYTDADGRARIQLSRLKAMAATLQSIPAGGWRREPYAGWLTERKSEVVYDESARRWILSDVAIWELHKREATTSVADDLAWFAVTNGINGECEGRIACYLYIHDRLQGEYLRRHPFGKHATGAVAVVKTTLDLVTAPGKPGAAYQFKAASDCKNLTYSVDSLSAAIKETAVQSKDAALGSLAGLRKLCQQ